MRINLDEPQKHVYEFGDFRLDETKRLLFKSENEIVPLMPKAFDTLLYLVQHNGKVVEKDDLMREVWADTIVEENNLTQNISILRRAFGEKPGEHRFIVTVPGRGYRFVADVRKIDAAKSEPLALTSGLQSESENQFATGKEQTTKDKTANRFWLGALIIFSVLGLSLLGFYLWRANTESVANTPIKIVAVLPFKPLVAENRDEALELGMADTLISKLGGAEEITVRPFSAIRRYNSVEQDSLSAGRDSMLKPFWTEAFKLQAIGSESWRNCFGSATADNYGLDNLKESSRIFSPRKIRFRNKWRQVYKFDWRAERKSITRRMSRLTSFI